MSKYFPTHWNCTPFKPKWYIIQKNEYYFDEGLNIYDLTGISDKALFKLKVFMTLHLYTSKQVYLNTFLYIGKIPLLNQNNIQFSGNKEWIFFDQGYITIKSNL